MSRPLDTSLDVYRQQIRAYRAMTRSQRLWLAATMSDEVRQLAFAGSERRRRDLSADILVADAASTDAMIEMTAPARPDTGR